MKQTLLNFDKVFGILKHERDEVPKDVRVLAETREQARKNKDWKLSDDLRNRIKELGWIVEDTATGYRLRKA